MMSNNSVSNLRNPVSERIPVPAEKIASSNLQIERKTFLFQLQENIRGRFLRITEEGKMRRCSIVIPSTGLEAVQRVLEEMSAAMAMPASVTDSPEESDKESLQAE